MDRTKGLKTIGLALMCLIVLALLGFSIYQHRLLQRIRSAESHETTLNRSAAESIPNAQSASRTASLKDRTDSDLDTLEAELRAAENELDAAYLQLDDEMARKEALAQKELELRMQYMESPAYRNSIRSMAESNFKEIFEEIGLSEADREKFADIYVDYYIAQAELSPEIASATTDAEKDDLRRRYAEIRDSLDEQMKALLGSDYDTYHDYTQMATTRAVIDQFKASLGSENQLTEAQEEAITEIMYEAQTQVFAEMGYDPRYEPEFPSDVEDGSADSQTANMAKIHSRSLEKSEGVLSDAQYEQYEHYLTSQREMMELASQLSD